MDKGHRFEKSQSFQSSAGEFGNAFGAEENITKRKIQETNCASAISLLNENPYFLESFLKLK